MAPNNIPAEVTLNYQDFYNWAHQIQVQEPTTFHTLEDFYQMPDTPMEEEGWSSDDSYSTMAQELFNYLPIEDFRDTQTNSQLRRELERRIDVECALWTAISSNPEDLYPPVETQDPTDQEHFYQMKRALDNLQDIQRIGIIAVYYQID